MLIVTFVNRMDASEYCRKRNGSLLSIHSKHDLELIKRYIEKARKNIWIGLKQSESGDFEWEDGSAMDFSNWRYNEPNHLLIEYCVEMKYFDLKWNDVKCYNN